MCLSNVHVLKPNVCGLCFCFCFCLMLTLLLWLLWPLLSSFRLLMFVVYYDGLFFFGKTLLLFLPRNFCMHLASIKTDDDVVLSCFFIFFPNKQRSAEYNMYIFCCCCYFFFSYSIQHIYCYIRFFFVAFFFSVYYRKIQWL